MATIDINHVMYNTVQCEKSSVKNIEIPPHEKIGLDWLIHQARTPEGADIGQNIILKLYPEMNYYTATFAYGTHLANEIFLLSYGAITQNILNKLWDKICGSVAPQNGISTPLDHRPGGPLVIDIVLPNIRPEAVSYLHSSDCYDFCLKLGRALLYPECLKL